MRLKNRKWLQPELDSSEKIIKDPQQYKGRWNVFFENDRPIHMEIGCGKGGFLIENYDRYADINFIGIEIQGKILAFASKNSRETSKRLIFLNADAKNLSEIFAPNEVSRIYLNFSDPWREKQKYIRRRLTHADFLNIYKEILAPGGQVHLKTDNISLFDFSVKQFSDNGWYLSEITKDLYAALPPDNIPTEYEKKFSEKGQKICRLIAKSL